MKELPPNAELKFSGVIFDVYQWPQKMFDGSVETFERVVRRNSAGVIGVVGDKIIVTFEEFPGRDKFTGVPCGFIESGEEPLQAAKRELLEETGYTSDSWIPFYSKNVGSKMFWIEHNFIARNCVKTSSQKLDVGEKISVKLLSFDEFITFISQEEFRLTNMALEILRMKERGELEKFKEKLFG